MSQKCPECSRNLDEFAIACPTCGWRLLEDIEARGEMDNRDLIHSSYDLYYRSTLKLLEERHGEAAIREANRTINVANAHQQGQARALRGYVHLTLGDPSAADVDLTEAVNLGHQEPEVLAWRAAARAHLDRWREVFEDLTFAVEILEEPHERYQQLLLAYRDEALAYFARECAAEPNNAIRYRDRGWVYLLLQELSAAAEDFHQATQLNPHDGLARAGLALTMVRQGKFAEGLAAAEAMTRDERPFVRRWGWEGLARSQHGLLQYAECRNSLEYLRVLAEDNIPLVMAVGRLRMELGDLSTAIVDFSSIVEQGGSGVDPALLARAQCYEKMGSLQRAVADYSRFLGDQPGHLASRLKRARLYAKLGEFETALADLQFIIDLEPRHLAAWVARADIELQRQHLDRASDACEQALAIDNRHWRLCLIVGQVNHQLQRYSDALDHLSRAIDVARTPEEKAESFFCRAQSHIALEQWDEAVFDLERATALRSNDIGAWLTLADIHARRDEWEGSANCLQFALQVTPVFPHQWRGVAQQVADGIVQQATRMVQRGHDDIRIFRRRAHALFFLNRLTESLADCDRVLAADIQDTETRIRRSMVLHQLGEYDAALKDLTRLLRRQPDHHYVRFLRARTLVQTEDYDAALSDLNKAIAAAPQVAKYHLLRGEVQRRRGKLTKAIRAFSRAQMIQPSDVRALRLRAEACLLAGYPAEAVADLSRAHEIEPENPEHLTMRGQALINLEQWDQAIEDFDAAVRLNSPNPKTYTGRAVALLRKGEHQQALLWLTKAVHRFADEREQAQLFLARGRVFSEMGRPSMAIADYSAVLKRMPPDSQSAAQVRLLRAIAWIRDGQYYAAERDLKKVRKILRDNALADRLLIWVRDRDQPMPSEVSLNGKHKQLARPPRVRDGIVVNRDDDRWLVAPPFDMWIVRDAHDAEFGPVSKLTLDQWAEQGRIGPGMKLLRSDWSKWKRAEKVYPDLA